jgi:hypothetical protein
MRICVALGTLAGGCIIHNSNLVPTSYKIFVSYTKAKSSLYFSIIPYIIINGRFIVSINAFCSNKVLHNN